MKRTALCFLIFCMFFSFSAVWADEARLVPLDARLEIVCGQVKLTRVGSAKTDVITHAVDLFAGDLLETLRESKAALTYSDGTVMKIKERTLVEIQPMSVKVFKGKTWYKFTKRGTEFKIETPTLVAGIRGTEFEVAVSSRKKSSVSVTKGAVAVKGRNSGKGLLLRQGYASHCEVGSDPVPAYKFNVELKNAEWAGAAWENKISKDDINARFFRYMNLKYEYGEDDTRTKEALKSFEEMKNKK